jgi:hypothetical protein
LDFDPNQNSRMENTQEQLDKLYLHYLDNIISDIEVFEKIRNFTFSSPLFIDLNVKNGLIEIKKYKVLYIGQQTKGWLNKEERKDLRIENHSEYLKALRKNYLEFNYGDRLGGEKYNGYLWQFQRPLIERINKKNKDNFGLLWSNVLRIDEEDDKITDEQLIEKIAYNNNEILRKEIEIIKPEVVVFVTGQYFDWLLKKTFEDLEFQSSINNNLNLNKLAVLKSKYLPILSFRTYHPRPLYQNQYLSVSRDEIINTIAESIETH